MNKKLTCSSCKSVHPWDCDKSYKALLESNLPSREIKCICGNTLTIIRLKTDIPEKSIIAKFDREAQKRAMDIIESRLKSPQIKCTNCDKDSGWYQERQIETIPIGIKKNLSCRHCGNIVLILEGVLPEKLKSAKKPKVDEGYAGAIAKLRNKPIVKRREKIEKTPMIDW